jgi:pyruvate/2-oxoacid:ferredoxin oxidoreductase alpha subunit
MLRDTGWIQLYCEDNQEVFDSILLAYRLGEDERLLLPVLVCQDAFVLSHTMMQTDIPSQAEVDAFLPDLHLPHRVADRAVAVGSLDRPRETEVHRRQHAEAMDRTWAVYAEIQDAFEAQFGRRPADPVVPYRMEDAEIALLSMGTTAATVRTAVDRAREAGVRVGALRVRMFRPFPEAILRRSLAQCARVGVIDRDISLGHGGVLWSESRGTAPPGAIVQSYMAGLGGGDVRPEHVLSILDDLRSRAAAGDPAFVETGS